MKKSNLIRTPRGGGFPSRGAAMAFVVLMCLGGCSLPLPWPPPPPVPTQVDGFDLLPDDSPVPSGTRILGQYQDLGIRLVNARAVSSSLYPDLPAESAPNVLVSRGDAPRYGTITVRFVRPTDGTSVGETNRVGAVFLDVDSPEEDARLEAYNRNGQLLQTVAVPVGLNGGRRYVEVNAAGIAQARLVLAEGGDGCAVDNLTYGAVPIELFVIEGYPAYNQERKMIEPYLRTERSGKEGDVFYLSHPGKKRYLRIRFGSSPEEFAAALQTPGAVVGYTGHSNYGLGALFSELPDMSPIEWVTSIADFMNVSAELVGMAWPHLVEKQAYPNLWVDEEEIAIRPQNYCTPVGIQRFPNDEGVGICQAFGEVQGEGMEKHHYHLTSLFTTEPRLIVHGGHADLPSPLRYAILYYRSCNSGSYYSENFQRGVLFHTTADSLVTAQDVFIEGILEDWSWKSMKYRLNRRQNNNDYFDFTQWTAHDRCDPECE